MKHKHKIEIESDLKTLIVKAGVRYWEDSTVNGVEDEKGDLIPCRDGEYWCPEIDIETGQIRNWKTGTVADIHYKVCDDGEYWVVDAEGKTVLKKEGYVPETMCPEGDGYGDYIIMEVDAVGTISKWKFNPEDFEEKDDV